MAPRIASVWRLAGAAAVAVVIAVAWARGPGDAVLAAPGIAALPTGISTPDAGEQARKPADQGQVIAKVTQPWPDAKELAARRIEAENLPLFKSEDPLPITITSDFRQIEKDRDPNTKKRYAGILQVASADGTPVTIPIQIGSRGHVRLDPRTCLNAPLKLEFVKKELKTTVFEGQKQLKLIVSCWNGDLYEQYVVSEYLAYRVFNLFTPRSYRSRTISTTRGSSMPTTLSLTGDSPSCPSASGCTAARAGPPGNSSRSWRRSATSGRTCSPWWTRFPA